MKGMWKNMKRTAAAGLSIILAISLGACGGRKSSDEETYGETFAALSAFTRYGSSGTGSEAGGASSGLASAGTAETGDALLDWWNGDWYGWWKMSSCTGYYEASEGHWWDICAAIDVGEDHVGTIELWDEDYSRDGSMITAAVSLNEAGTGEHGTMYSEGGWFTDMELSHADWIVDPGLLKYDNMIMIDGWYENGDDSYKYEIYLRPWGLIWDDMSEEELPYYYQSWYLPLVEAGKAMPDSIDTSMTFQ